MSVRIDREFSPVLNAHGKIAPGALLYLYAAGTLDRVQMFADEALLTPYGKAVEANAAAVFPPIFVVSGRYKVNITTAEGASIPGYPADGLEFVEATDMETRMAAMEAEIAAMQAMGKSE